MRDSSPETESRALEKRAKSPPICGRSRSKERKPHKFSARDQKFHDDGGYEPVGKGRDSSNSNRSHVSIKPLNQMAQAQKLEGKISLGDQKISTESNTKALPPRKAFTALPEPPQINRDTKPISPIMGQNNSSSPRIIQQQNGGADDGGYEPVGLERSKKDYEDVKIKGESAAKYIPEYAKVDKNRKSEAQKNNDGLANIAEGDNKKQREKEKKQLEKEEKERVEKERKQEEKERKLREKEQREQKEKEEKERKLKEKQQKELRDKEEKQRIQKEKFEKEEKEKARKQIESKIKQAEEKEKASKELEEKAKKLREKQEKELKEKEEKERKLQEKQERELKEKEERERKLKEKQEKESKERDEKERKLKEKEERDLKEKYEKELREKDERERKLKEKQEKELKEKEEKECKLKEKQEREIREKEEKERKLKEKQEKELKEKEEKECKLKEKLEREIREKEERERKLKEKQEKELKEKEEKELKLKEKQEKELRERAEKEKKQHEKREKELKEKEEKERKTREKQEKDLREKEEKKSKDKHKGTVGEDMQHKEFLRPRDFIADQCRNQNIVTEEPKALNTVHETEKVFQDNHVTVNMPILVQQDFPEPSIDNEADSDLPYDENIDNQNYEVNNQFDQFDQFFHAVSPSENQHYHEPEIVNQNEPEIEVHFPLSDKERKKMEKEAKAQKDKEEKERKQWEKEEKKREEKEKKLKEKLEKEEQDRIKKEKQKEENCAKKKSKGLLELAKERINEITEKQENHGPIASDGYILHNEENTITQIHETDGKKETLLSKPNVNLNDNDIVDECMDSLDPVNEFEAQFLVNADHQFSYPEVNSMETDQEITKKDNIIPKRKRYCSNYIEGVNLQCIVHSYKLSIKRFISH